MVSRVPNWKHLFAVLMIVLTTFLAVGCDTTYLEGTGKMVNQPSSAEVHQPGKEENHWSQSIRWVAPAPADGVTACTGKHHPPDRVTAARLTR